VKAQDFVDAARSYLGVPFRHQGRTEHGVDCIGLVILARLKLGPWDATRHDIVNYRRNPKDALDVTLPKFLEQIFAPEVGALAAIRWPKMKVANHIAILTPATIIHSYAEVGRVIETGYREPWPRQTVSLWRIPGIVQ
jgi:hypothetical protein